ncbi:MAG: hypothetical protein PGN13_00255 [Patulibacter minatonensis]
MLRSTVVLSAALMAAAVPSASAAPFVLDPPAPLSGAGPSSVSFLSASPNAQTVLFSSPDALVPADTDGKTDLYVRRGAADPQLLTAGSVSVGAEFSGSGQAPRVLADGSVAFLTPNPLAANDNDLQTDLYLAPADGSAPILVSDNGNGTGNDSTDIVSNVVASSDGTTLAFTTNENLTAADTQSSVPDVYRWRRATGPQLVTAGSAQGTAAGISADGNRVSWESNAAQPGISDSDGSGIDLFSADAPFASVSSPTASNNGAGGADLFAGASPDGSTVVVRTTESFDPADSTAGSLDLYAFRGSSAAKLLTGAGSSNGSNPRLLRVCNDGAAVFLTEKNLGGDNDSGADDVYRATAATTTRLTAGNGTGAASDAQPLAVSDDCSAVAWVTTGKESAFDTDAEADVYYAKDGASVRLVTGAAPGAARPLPDALVNPVSLPRLGAGVLFATTAAETADDTDAVSDVYRFDVASSLSGLVSTGTVGAPLDQDLAWPAADASAAIVATKQGLPGGSPDATDLYRYREQPPVVATPVPTPTPTAQEPGAGANPGAGGAQPIPTQLARPVADPPAGRLELGSKGVKLRVKKGKGTILTSGKATCGATTSCTLTVSVVIGTKTLVSRSSTVPSRRTATISVALSSAQLRKLRKTKTVKVLLNAELSAAASITTSASARATLKTR